MNARQTIDFVLRYYENVNKACYEKRHDPNTPRCGGGGHAFVSDPTASRAIRNAEELDVVLVFYGAAVNGKTESLALERPESWMRVVDLTKEHFAGQVQGSIISMKYDSNLSREDITGSLKIGRTLYHIALNEVFVYAEGVVDGLKLNPRNRRRRH